MSGFGSLHGMMTEVNALRNELGGIRRTLASCLKGLADENTTAEKRATLTAKMEEVVKRMAEIVGE